MTDATPSSIEPRPATVLPVSLGDLARLLEAPVVPDSGSDVVVTGITQASASVTRGDIYAALPGSRTHGARYAAVAARSGAVAAVTDPDGAAECAAAGLATLVVERPRRRLGALSAFVYGRPAERLSTLAVTGTQGKTTTTYLMEAGLEAAGVVPAVVGSIGTRVAGTPVRSALTTPEAPDLHALFAVMVERSVQACALEVSSHALVQGRVDGVRFDVATFLNLGRDHLDFHADMEDYYAAKASLFTEQRAKRAVINVDDAHGRRLIEETSLPVVTFSPSGGDADWRASDPRPGPCGTHVLVDGPRGLQFAAYSPLSGSFNVANTLAALVTLSVAGVDAETAARGIAGAPGVPGRMQRVDAGQDFTVLVDYAHKPDALQAVLSAVRPVTDGRVIVVIGAGGDRDPGKRPLMGEIGARLADVLVVTDDNPRGEDPARIRAQVLAGVGTHGRSHVHEIGDRGEAIRYAIDTARSGDTLVVAGKGHETGQEVAGVTHPFDDTVVVTAAIQVRHGHGEPS
ncbi:MAG: UDP-N-acetylmuramoyl-L-alanyl-D-glutamate--2,6-diaminopimelate ligase [Nocardioidaceae bacterium]